MADELEVDTRVSASLDPGVIALIEDYDEDTRPLLGQTETALSAAFEALKGIHDAKAAAATNPTLNEYAQLIEVDNYASKRMAVVQKMWGSAVEALNNNVVAMEEKLESPSGRGAAGGRGQLRRADGCRTARGMGGHADPARRSCIRQAHSGGRRWRGQRRRARANDPETLRRFRTLAA